MVNEAPPFLKLGLVEFLRRWTSETSVYLGPSFFFSESIGAMTFDSLLFSFLPVQKIWELKRASFALYFRLGEFPLSFLDLVSAAWSLNKPHNWRLVGWGRRLGLSIRDLLWAATHFTCGVLAWVDVERVRAQPSIRGFGEDYQVMVFKRVCQLSRALLSRWGAFDLLPWAL